MITSIKNIKVLLGLIVILSISGTKPAVGQTEIDYFASPNILKFADYLYQQQDYQRAAGEYTRYLLARPDSARTQVARRLIGCYTRIGDYERALTALQFVPDSLVTGDCGWFRQRAELLFQVQRYDALHEWLSTHPTCRNDTTAVLIGSRYLKAHNWKLARREFQTITDESAGRDRFLQLTEQAENTPQKSPLLAGALAAIVPGSGKLYLGRKTDALFSLVATGVMAWRSYAAFDEDGNDSTAGWVYGSLGAFFYGGNIYGSYVGAKVYNQQKRQEMDVRIEAEIQLFLD